MLTARVALALTPQLQGEIPRDEATGDGTCDEGTCGLRNFLAQRMVVLYGEHGAAEFCQAYLDPRRWSGLQQSCFLDG